MSHFLKIIPPDPHRRGEQEPDFRWGYHQGAYAVIEGLKNGFTPEEMSRLKDEDLRDWRASWQTASLPPDPKR